MLCVKDPICGNHRISYMEIIKKIVTWDFGRRTRQISTSLVQDPVLDDNLQDFHGHLLEPGRQPLDVRYWSSVVGSRKFIPDSGSELSIRYPRSKRHRIQIPTRNKKEKYFSELGSGSFHNQAIIVLDFYCFVTSLWLFYLWRVM